MDWFTSDLHLGHLSILKHRPEFTSVEEMDEVILTNLYNIPKGSDLYILGDIAWNQQSAKKILDRKPKNIQLHLILGNHDHKISKALLQSPLWTSVEYFKVVKEQGFTLSLFHYPMIVWYRSHIPTSIQLYGHIHKSTPQITPVGKQINICTEFWGYTPQPLCAILQKLEHMPDNWEIEEIRRRDNDTKHSFTKLPESC